MDLWLVRHAIAEDLAPGADDAERRLTQDGRKRFVSVVGWLTDHGIRFDLVLHSPKRRAVETAELLRERARTQPRVCAALSASPERAFLQSLQGDSVALVGHAPWLNETLSLLIAGSRDLAPQFEIKKGGLVLVSGEPRPAGMALRCLIAPRMVVAKQARRPRVR